MKGPLPPSTGGEVGRKDDDGKLRCDLWDDAALDELAAVLTVGAKRYGDNNWRKVADLQNRYAAAGRRHMSARRQGELLDPDDGLLHSAHEMCCAMFRLADDLDKHPELRETVKTRLAKALANLKGNNGSGQGE